jgi:hypothetical protein
MGLTQSDATIWAGEAYPGFQVLNGYRTADKIDIINTDTKRLRYTAAKMEQ